MQNKLTPRFLLIGLVLVWGIWSLWPTVKLQNLSNDEKDALRIEGKLEEIETKAIKQGLDLKGGMYIVLEVDLPTLIENIAINKDGKLSSIFDKIRADISISPEADFFDLFSEHVEKNQLKLSRYYYDYGSSSDDILSSLNDEAEDAINRVLEILQNRIDQFGVAEPTINLAKDHAAKAVARLRKPGGVLRGNRATSTKPAHSTIYSEAQSIKNAYPNEYESIKGEVENGDRGGYSNARDKSVGTAEQPLKG